MRPRFVDALNAWTGTSLGEWLVPYPALVYALAMLAGLIIFVQRSRRTGLPPYYAAGSAVAAMVGGLVGARVFYVLWHIDNFPSPFSALFAVSGATFSWGAYMGGITCFILYLYVKRQPLLPWLDMFAPIHGLGVFIGRWACFLNGDDFGKVSTLPWAVSYPPGSIPFTHQVREGLIPLMSDMSLAVHPVQLYLGLNGLLLFILFSHIWRRNVLKPGQLTVIYFGSYAFSRFWLEFFRGDYQQMYFNLFTSGQLFAGLLFLILATGILFIKLKLHFTVNRTRINL